MEKNKESTSGDLQQLITELGKPEVQDSLTSLLSKLPEIEKSLHSVSNIVDFGQSVVEDKTVVNKYDQLASTYNINIETVTAIVALFEKLPKLVQLIEQLENIIDFVTAVLNDEKSTEYLINNAKEQADPYLKKGKQGIELLEQIQVRAESNPQNISLFSLMKWIKDPAVQKGLNYAQATIDILNEKQQKQ